MRTFRKKTSISIFTGIQICLFLILVSCKETLDGKAENTDHKHTNALIHETSPYLLQHAHNPVDWRAWSQQALDEAKKKDKLVLISIGYSSCHWCHVMEEETFENDSIALLMNEHFINIKVDREERPDVDNVYMTAVQLMKGSGGWPLNVITLPNGKPLYGGTYHTKAQWQKVLSEISRLYNEDPKKAAEYSDMVAQGVQEYNLVSPATDFERLNVKTLTQSVEHWKQKWDTQWGGDTRTEKFMLPSNLAFLLDYALLSNDQASLEQVELTLDKIAMGGIYDHIGGGFFRYSTDAKWKIPHFEKMLYDNAQAISLYSKAYKVFKKESYKDLVLGTIAFLENEMKNPEGGYYAALDADSEGREGEYYVWEKKELQQILGEDYTLFAAYYTINDAAIWEEKKYVLHKLLTDKTFIANQDIDKNTLQNAKKTWQRKLLDARQKKVRPNTDDKILTSWNALLIAGYTDAYTAFENPEYIKKARAILDFIQAKSYKNKILGHTYKKDSKHINGFLEDYSFLANAALRLYSVSMELKDLELAKELTDTAKVIFKDAPSGMYTYNQDEELISKIIKTDDGVLQSANSVMAHNLFRLGHIYYNVEDINKAKQMTSTMVPLMTEDVYAYANWAALLTNNAYPYYEVAIVGTGAQKSLLDLAKTYIPNTLLVGSKTDSDLALFEGRFTETGTYIYVCQDNSCKLPVETVTEAVDLLKSTEKRKKPDFEVLGEL